MKLLLVGATGLVGRHVLALALTGPRIQAVTAPVRRPLPPHPKLSSPQVDFDTLPERADWWAADAVNCALGTTRRAAGAASAFRKVDYGYCLAVARLARWHDTPTFVLNSAMGADPASRFLYTRTKGELERDLQALGYGSLTLVRPGLIGGKRDHPRLGEQVASALLGVLHRHARGRCLLPRQPGLGLRDVFNLPAVIRPIETLPPAKADDDAQMVRLWLARSASPNTRRNYEREARQFMVAIGKPLGDVRMGELQDYIAARPGSSATVAVTAAALKSLFAFAQEVGFLRFNIGAAMKVPPIKNTLAERIMAEADALLMIRQEQVLRNRVLLTVLYGGGLRISEVCGLCWRDLMVRDEAGQATVFGKGGKTRAVLLSAATWKVLTALRGEAPADQPVFLSRKGGALDPSAVHRIVKAAAARAGLPGEVSAHWLRHAHASHSLDRGGPIHLVQATLGHASVATTGRYLHARPSESSARFLGV